jgi:Beta-galactosidase trimerisation domain
VKIAERWNLHGSFLAGRRNTILTSNKRSIATIGVVMGQRTSLFYKLPTGVTVSHYMDGLYSALLDGRFFFDFVHEEKLSADELRKYSTWILPNTALLSDKQCRQIADFANAGSSLLATFETSMYDERGRKRPNFGLADVFGIEKAGEVIETNGNAYCAPPLRSPAVTTEATFSSRAIYSLTTIQ